jgi:hypothetical protein
MGMSETAIYDQGPELLCFLQKFLECGDISEPSRVIDLIFKAVNLAFRYTNRSG